MAESSAWMRAELARMRSQKQEAAVHACSSFRRPLPLRDFCVDVNDARDQPDCKGNDGRDDRPIQKATMTQEEARTARRPEVLTDERG